jgi:hypothetical protein
MDDRGAATAEYAIVILAAAGLGVVLYGLLTGDWVTGRLYELLQRAFTVST